MAACVMKNVFPLHNITFIPHYTLHIAQKANNLCNKTVVFCVHSGDSSLVYIGVNKHEDEDVGLYDTVLSPEDYRATFENVVKKGIKL